MQWINLRQLVVSNQIDSLNSITIIFFEKQFNSIIFITIKLYLIGALNELHILFCCSTFNIEKLNNFYDTVSGHGFSPRYWKSQTPSLIKTAFWMKVDDIQISRVIGENNDEEQINILNLYYSNWVLFFTILFILTFNNLR